METGQKVIEAPLWGCPDILNPEGLSFNSLYDSCCSFSVLGHEKNPGHFASTKMEFLDFKSRISTRTRSR